MTTFTVTINGRGYGPTEVRPNASVLQGAATLPCGHGGLRDIPLLGT